MAKTIFHFEEMEEILGCDSILRDIIFAPAQEREEALWGFAKSADAVDRCKAAEFGSDEIRDFLCEDSDESVRAVIARRGPEPLRFALSDDSSDLVRRRVAAFATSRGVRRHLLSDRNEGVRLAAMRESDSDVVAAYTGMCASDVPGDYRLL